MKRLFTAIKIHPDPGFLKSYRNLRSALYHEQIKWVEEHNIHVTLHFFGETEEQIIVRINTVLEKLAAETKPFTLRLSGLGIFGSSYAPRVIWTGIGPGQPLLHIMQMLKTDLMKAGFETDRQNLVPHLTLGRIKSLRDKTLFQRVLSNYKNIISVDEQIQEMILFESKLLPTGPVYSIQQSFPFSKKNPDDQPGHSGEAR
ncbi:MAG: RNA 2',3'-cyclic phosphodiesterase [Bacteroidales bacterium]|jgi:2'-5' RNA ligase|nr:RNA 2',3'-cyclic phosphodiesterase [Bacteroidales bacterium]